MNTFLIIVGIYLALSINFFRWTRPGRDSRVIAWAFTIATGGVLVLFSLVGYIKEERVLLENPSSLVYASFGKTNYLMYRLKEEDPATLIWIGNLEEEKNKKFYQVNKINVWGKQAETSVERF